MGLTMDIFGEKIYPLLQIMSLLHEFGLSMGMGHGGSRGLLGASDRQTLPGRKRHRS